jgi:surface antigen
MSASSRHRPPEEYRGKGPVKETISVREKLRFVVVFGVVSACLTGCSSSTQPGGVDKSAIGLAVGSVAGGIAGSYIPGYHVAGALVGAAAGGAVGAAIGAALDEQDRQEMARLTQLSFETGQDQIYASPRTNARVQIKIVKTVTVAKKLCRTVQHHIELRDGSTSSDTVRACKGPNGWVV